MRICAPRQRTPKTKLPCFTIFHPLGIWTWRRDAATPDRRPGMKKGESKSCGTCGLTLRWLSQQPGIQVQAAAAALDIHPFAVEAAEAVMCTSSSISHAAHRSIRYTPEIRRITRRAS
jgi:hypothetical protein